MGKPTKGSERRTFVGESEGYSKENPAKLSEALQSAADEAVAAGVVSQKGGPVWYDITGMQVEIANQHIKTYRVIVTPSG